MLQLQHRSEQNEANNTLWESTVLWGRQVCTRSKDLESALKRPCRKVTPKAGQSFGAPCWHNTVLSTGSWSRFCCSPTYNRHWRARPPHPGPCGQRCAVPPVPLPKWGTAPAGSRGPSGGSPLQGTAGKVVRGRPSGSSCPRPHCGVRNGLP